MEQKKSIQKFHKNDTIFKGKVMIKFFVRLLVQYMPKRSIINAKVYDTTLQNLKLVLEEKVKFLTNEKN